MDWPCVLVGNGIRFAHVFGTQTFHFVGASAEEMKRIQNELQIRGEPIMRKCSRAANHAVVKLTMNMIP